MPITKTKELSQKIDTGPPSADVNGADYDDVDSFDDEFINIVMPLIQMSSDQSEPFKGNQQLLLLFFSSPSNLIGTIVRILEKIAKSISIFCRLSEKKNVLF